MGPGFYPDPIYIYILFFVQYLISIMMYYDCICICIEWSLMVHVCIHVCMFFHVILLITCLLYRIRINIHKYHTSQLAGNSSWNQCAWNPEVHEANHVSNICGRLSKLA